MSHAPTSDSLQSQLLATKQEIERARKENLKVSLVEVKLDGGGRILPLPE
jgi:hypothetical protein